MHMRYCVGPSSVVRDKEMSVNHSILRNLSSDPEIRLVQLYAVFFGELVISRHPLSRSSEDKKFLV